MIIIFSLKLPLIKIIFVAIKISVLYGNTSNSTTISALADSREGYRLFGKIIDEFDVESLITCIHRCLHYSNCKSTNALIGERFPVVDVCQLMSDNLQSIPNGLEAGEGWIYSDVKVRLFL